MGSFERIPRKLKKKIPTDTVYCYIPTSGFKKLDSGQYGYTIKLCPFYTDIKCKDKPESKQNEIDKEYPEEVVGWCKLVKCEIDDQCKSCGLKFGKF